MSEAWNLGVRYFDTAPLYALAFLKSAWAKRCLSIHVMNRSEQQSRPHHAGRNGRSGKTDFGEKGGLFEHGLKNKILNATLLTPRCAQLKTA